MTGQEVTAVTERVETRAQRRIRKAVEARGRKLLSLEYEPWYDGGEKSGICGGWFGETEPSGGICNYDNKVMGLSVEETIAWVDRFFDPPEPCDCPEVTYPQPLQSSSPLWMHLPECRWHLRYWLRWWGPKRDARSSDDD